jgi:hypothetical protein
MLMSLIRTILNWLKCNLEYWITFGFGYKMESGTSNFGLHLVTKWLQNYVKISNRSNHFEGYRGAGVTSNQHPELKFEILNFLVSYKKSFCGYISLHNDYIILWNVGVKNHNLGCWCDGPHNTANFVKSARPFFKMYKT